MKDTFSQMHPVVNITYFAFVISFSMFLMNPVCLIAGFLCAFFYGLYLSGSKTVKLTLMYIMPMLIMVSVVNPVFNHAGMTILTYFPWGNPLTLESILYGIAAAVLLSIVVLWFSCFNKVMTTDKFVYLFGRILPSLSLLLSMTLRFVPRFISQFNLVRKSQRCIGHDISDGSILRRLKNAVKIVSIMISWALENAIETADSMKSRGYGLKGRTAYSVFKFEKRDGFVLTAIFLCGITVLYFIINQSIKFRYFPSVKGDILSINSLICYAFYIILMLLPLFINILEDMKWKYLKSKI